MPGYIVRYISITFPLKARPHFAILKLETGFHVIPSFPFLTGLVTINNVGENKSISIIFHDYEQEMIQTCETEYMREVGSNFQKD